jgi:hypothetical protein
VDLGALRNGGHRGALVKVTNETTGKIFSTSLRTTERSGLQ